MAAQGASLRLGFGYREDKDMRRLTICAAFAALAGAASAQTVRPMDFNPSGITVRGGVVLPLDSTLSDVDNLFINIGLEFQIPRPLLRSGETYLSIDYWTNSFNDQDGTVLPIFVNHRFYQDNNKVPGARTYWFFGLGAAIIDVTSSGTAIAGRAGVGKELGENIIFETAVNLSDRAGGARANAVAFNIGYRF
jgi:hypothetical protein